MGSQSALSCSFPRCSSLSVIHYNLQICFTSSLFPIEIITILTSITIEYENELKVMLKTEVKEILKFQDRYETVKLCSFPCNKQRLKLIQIRGFYHENTVLDRSQMKGHIPWICLPSPLRSPRKQCPCVVPEWGQVHDQNCGVPVTGSLDWKGHPVP